jgi:protein-S-isoprenylcysteine O-methyltransferase Ste14
MPRLAVALLYGAICHLIFAFGVGTMIVEMAFGLSRSLGPFEGWAAVLANTLLIAQFAAGHSLLLTPRGQRVLDRLAPAEHARTLRTTTYATVAAAQIGLLFLLWSPSGVIWWQAQGVMLYICLGFYGLAWALLGMAMVDAGLSVQSGVLGWWSLARGKAPQFPPMPETGLFRLVRQPIYVAFTLTLWTVPTWTPDQLFLAVTLTAYCVLAPLHKERRYARLFGERWQAYKARVPYWLPRLGKARGRA